MTIFHRMHTAFVDAKDTSTWYTSIEIDAVVIFARIEDFQSSADKLVSGPSGASSVSRYESWAHY